MAWVEEGSVVRGQNKIGRNHRSGELPELA
jgi:hypothetical protein